MIAWRLHLRLCKTPAALKHLSKRYKTLAARIFVGWTLKNLKKYREKLIELILRMNQMSYASYLSTIISCDFHLALVSELK